MVKATAAKVIAHEDANRFISNVDSGAGAMAKTDVGRVRVSIHLFNDEEDIDTLIDFLAAVQL